MTRCLTNQVQATILPTSRHEFVVGPTRVAHLAYFTAARGHWMSQRELS
jgi:hypothetical protein